MENYKGYRDELPDKLNNKKSKIEMQDRTGEFMGLEISEIIKKIEDEPIEGPLDISASYDVGIKSTYRQIMDMQTFLLKKEEYLNVFVKYTRAEKIKQIILDQASIDTLKDLLVEYGGMITPKGFVDAETLILRIDEQWFHNKGLNTDFLPEPIERFIYWQKLRIANDLYEQINEKDYVDLENPTHLPFLNKENFGHLIATAKENKYATVSGLVSKFGWEWINSNKLNLPIQWIGPNYAIAVDNTSNANNVIFYKLSLSDIQLPNDQSLDKYINEKKSKELEDNKPKPPYGPPPNSASISL